MAEYYLWFKALHIISVIAWMAGMLYLLASMFITRMPRRARSSQKHSKSWNAIVAGNYNPSMIFVFVFGGLMLATGRCGLVDGLDLGQARDACSYGNDPRVVSPLAA